MAFLSPQGIDFRAGSAAPYDTDPANCDYEIYGGTTGNYGSHVTLQGNNVGWMGPMNGSGGTQGRDRNSSIDRRLGGMQFNTLSSEVLKYAFDVPPGTYRVRIAAGDYNYARPVKVEVFDNTTSLGVLCSTATTAGGKFRDATNVEYTAAAWPGSNALSGNLTVATGPLVFRIGDGTNQCYIAHIWVESVAAGGAALQAASLSVASATGALSAQIRFGANAAAVSQAPGGLSAQVRLSAGAIAQAVASAGLSAGIRLSASAVASAAATGQLGTLIKLIGAAAGQASASASLTGGASGLAANATGQAGASGSLTAGIKLAGAATGQASAPGSLTTTPSGLAANAAAAAAAPASLTIQIQFSATALAQAAGLASLTTQPAGLSGSAQALSAAPAALTASIRLSADALAAAIASGSLTTQIPLSTAAIAQAAGSASLGTGTAGMGGQASASASAAGTLTAQIRLGGSAQAQAAAAGTLAGMPGMTGNTRFVVRASRHYIARPGRNKYPAFYRE